MVSIKTKEDAISWLESVLDHTTDGDNRAKAVNLLKEDLTKDKYLEATRELVAQQFNVDVE